MTGAVASKSLARLEEVQKLARSCQASGRVEFDFIQAVALLRRDVLRAANELGQLGDQSLTRQAAGDYREVAYLLGGLVSTVMNGDLADMENYLSELDQRMLSIDCHFD